MLSVENENGWRLCPRSSSKDMIKSHKRIMQVFSSRRVVANGYLEVRCLLLVGKDARIPAQHQQAASDSLITLVLVDLTLALI